MTVGELKEILDIIPDSYPVKLLHYECGGHSLVELTDVKLDMSAGAVVIETEMS